MKLGLLGFVIGALAVYAVRMARVETAPQVPVVAESPAAPRAARSARLSLSACPEVEGGEDLASLRREVDGLQAAIATREASLKPWIGDPRDFPEEFDPRAGPERADSEVEKALAGSPATVRYIDCSEYPCLAVIDIPFGAQGEIVDEWVEGTFARVQAHFGLPASGTYAGDQSGGSFGIAVIPLSDAGGDTELIQRTDVRQEVIVADVGWEVAG
ncbi:hypothetical protein LBMAG42_33380 [Deltaproteobacteria bacterium]|nr:hypothetical protein LBMAG42_33380 [Deltaproteobacteria bacterium]